jgi:hypothetical protein
MEHLVHLVGGGRRQRVALGSQIGRLASNAGMHDAGTQLDFKIRLHGATRVGASVPGLEGRALNWSDCAALILIPDFGLGPNWVVYLSVSYISHYVSS